MEAWFTEEEAFALLKKLFPEGLGGADVEAALCPEGWSKSALRLAFHPTPEQQFAEALRWHKNSLRLLSLRRKDDTETTLPDPNPPPDRETFMAEARSRPDSQDESDERELGRLVGLCLWDILSDNHDLVLPDGSRKYLGSFRATAGIIADFFSGEESSDNEDPWDFGRMDYCEFYMGTWAVGGRTDLAPVYRMIFARLRTTGLDWQYAFPKLGVIRFKKPETDDPEWAGYDPSAALEEEEKEREHAKFEADLEEAHRESLEAAKKRAPPVIVTAYHETFGYYPPGWPPWEP